MTFFCPLPFTSVDISPDGQTRPCCKFVPNTRHNLQDYWHSKEMRTVRQQLLAGEPPKQCQRCVNEEHLSGHSMRMMALRSQPNNDQIQQAQDPDYQQIDQILICTSNVCNLHCLPCVENASFVRQRELYELGLISDPPVLLAQKLDLGQIPYTDQITRVTLVGGEPFLDRQSRQLVDSMIDLGLASRIELHINTNLTCIEPVRLALLQQKFNSVTIKGSIDGIGPVNDYLRWPSKWNTIETAVDHIQTLGINLVIITALSNLALVHYDQILDWAQTKGIQDLFMSKVTTPQELQFDRLPGHVKQRLLPRFQQRLAEWSGIGRTKFLLETLVEILSLPGCTDDKWQKTLDWLNLHDQHRGNSWRALWPELVDTTTHD